MSINIKQDGRAITARMPTLAELDGIIEAPRSPIAYKTLAKACCLTPTYGELAKAKPACGPGLGMVIAGASGLAAEVVELGEDDIPREVAEAIVAAEGKGFRDLQALTTEVGGVVRHFVQRMPKETDCDKYMRSETAAAAKTFCEVITVYPTKEAGGVESLQQEAPGLYVPLAKYALQRAGLLDEATLGEA